MSEDITDLDERELMEKIIREGRLGTPSTDDIKKTAKDTLQEKKKPAKQSSKVYSYEGTTPIKITDHLSASQWIVMKSWANVDSSNISKIRYDIDLQELYVQFKSEVVYAYRQVPDYIAAEMFNCPSMGKFVWKRLKNVFGFSKL